MRRCQRFRCFPTFVAATECLGVYLSVVAGLGQTAIRNWTDQSYHFRHEPILYGWIENGPHYFTDIGVRIPCSRSTSRTQSESHPTTKPVELIARMVANNSRPGELVYDPFCGSGSTLPCCASTRPCRLWWAAHCRGRVHRQRSRRLLGVRARGARTEACGEGTPCGEKTTEDLPINLTGIGVHAR